MATLLRAGVRGGQVDVLEEPRRGQGARHAQALHALLLGESRGVAELVVLAARLGEPAAEVEHARLTQLELELRLEVRSGARQERRAVEVRVGRGRVFLLEEEAHDADVDLELVLVRPAKDRVSFIPTPCRGYC